VLLLVQISLSKAKPTSISYHLKEKGEQAGGRARTPEVYVLVWVARLC